jgi:DHA1 family bicyclomycin/chloramphenicol resistance-like MFS transporter
MTVAADGHHYRHRLTIILGALTAMGPLAIDMYLPALPGIARELGVPIGSVQRSLASYFIGISLGQALYGPLSDRFGRKPALYLGLGIFVGASLGCAFTTSVTQLVIFRFLQALGGCAPLVVPRAVVRDYFDGPESVRMLSMLILVMMLGPILAPFIGGQLLVHYGWRSMFFVLSGYGLVWLVVAAWLLPESLHPDQRRRQSAGAIAATYAGILRDRQYLAWVVTGGLVFAGLLAYISGSSFVYIELFDVAPERFGLYFGANAIGLMAASQINRYLAGRVHPEAIVRAVLPIGVGAGAVLLVDASTGFGGFAGILVPLFCFVICHGFVGPNTTALAMSPYGAMAGSASALMGTIQFLLGAASGSLVSAFGNGTAVPFAAVIAACAVLAFAVHAVRPSHVAAAIVRSPRAG